MFMDKHMYSNKEKSKRKKDEKAKKDDFNMGDPVYFINHR